MTKTSIQEAALDYINSGREKNFYAANRTVTLQVFGQAVDVETIWYSKDEDKVFLHCGCKEFEADIDIGSLSDENQERMREVLACVEVPEDSVPGLMRMHENKPLVFLFRVADMDREEVNRGLSREECFKRCANFYTLDELGDAWNDTDDDMRFLIDVKTSWMYVSLPEPKKPEPWTFNEQEFIGRYCPMEGGNDYLGWIDDICKLLDGEAEPGDAASTGEYANCSEKELRKELKRLTTIVLTQAVERYVDDEYMD